MQITRRRRRKTNSDHFSHKLKLSATRRLRRKAKDTATRRHGDAATRGKMSDSSLVFPSPRRRVAVSPRRSSLLRLRREVTHLAEFGKRHEFVERDATNDQLCRLRLG